MGIFTKTPEQKKKIEEKKEELAKRLQHLKDEKEKQEQIIFNKSPYYKVIQVVLKEKLVGVGNKNLKEVQDVLNEEFDKGFQMKTISFSNIGSKGLLGGDRMIANIVFEKII